MTYHRRVLLLATLALALPLVSSAQTPRISQPEPRLDAISSQNASVDRVDSQRGGLANAACVGRGGAYQSVSNHIDFGTPRPLQRELLKGVSTGAPETGTIIRFYSSPMEFIGDFDSSGSVDTVRAITEVAGPGGVNPCPGGPNSDGCTMGERLVEEPFASLMGDWTIPAQLSIVRSEASIGVYAPRTFELRFTETGSLAYHGFTSGRIANFPVEIWDIGEVGLGAANDPSDDVRMAVVAFSDGGGECDFNFDEVTVSGGATLSDRLYAYYFAPGSDYASYEAAVNEWVPQSEALGVPLTGELRRCSAGASGPFSCSGIDMLSYLPVEVIGNAAVNDMWGWEDPMTGKEYALVGRVNGLSFVDISDPLNPTYLGELPTATFATTWRDVKVHDNVAYVVADNAGGGGIQVFDLTRLRTVASPPETFAADLVTNAFIGDAHNIAINNDSGFLYGALAGGTCGRNGIAMVDLAVPLNPAFAGCMSFNNPSVQVHDLHCVNYAGPDTDYTGSEICFTANEEDGIGIADVTDKSSPSEIARADYPLLQYAHQGWLTEDHQYFIMGDELDEVGFGINTRTLIWDVKDLNDPQLLTTYDGNNLAIDHNLYVKDNLVYEANYSSGLRVIDISDIMNPTEVAFFDTYPADDDATFSGAWTVYPFFASGTIAVTSRQEGLVLLRFAQSTGVAESEDQPSGFRLEQNYPNPFNPETTISFEVPTTSIVRLAVYDLLGREVRLLMDKTVPAGHHEVLFDARGLPTGTYMYRLEAGEFSETRHLMLIR